MFEGLVGITGEMITSKKTEKEMQYNQLSKMADGLMTEVLQYGDGR